MADGAQKVAVSDGSRALLAILAKKLDQADAYKLIRHLVCGEADEHRLTVDDVIERVIYLCQLRQFVLDGDSGDAVLEIARLCGQPPESDAADELMADAVVLSKLPPGWTRTEMVNGHGEPLIRWAKGTHADAPCFDLFIGSDGRPRPGSLDVDDDVPLAELGQLLLIEARRAVGP